MRACTAPSGLEGERACMRPRYAGRRFERCRELFRAALKAVTAGDAVLAVCDAWELFEREARVSCGKAHVGVSTVWSTGGVSDGAG